jgi:hypothetical protein
MTRAPTLTATLAVAVAASAASALWRARPDLLADPWVSVAVADGLFLVGFGVDELLRRDRGGL